MRCASTSLPGAPGWRSEWVREHYVAIDVGKACLRLFSYRLTFPVGRSGEQDARRGVSASDRPFEASLRQEGEKTGNKAHGCDGCEHKNAFLFDDDDVLGQFSDLGWLAGERG